MTISYVAAGATSTGTTSVTPAYPAGLASNDLLILSVVNKYPTDGPATPSGWTLLKQSTGGSGASGANVGTVYTTVFYKVSDGTESGTETVTVTSGNSTIAKIVAFRNAGGAWTIWPSGGSQNTAGVSWSVTCDTSVRALVDDLVVSVVGINTDLSTIDAAGSSTVTLGAATFGTNTERFESDSGDGDNTSLQLATHTVTGADTAVPVVIRALAGSAADRPAGSAIAFVLSETPVVTNALTGVEDTPFLFPDTVPALVAAPPAGLLDDFAYSEHTLPDAAITEVRGWLDFASNAAWVRPYVNASRPRTNYFTRAEGSEADQVFWRQAEYAEVSLHIENVDTTRSHYLDSVMFDETEVHLNLLNGWATHFEGGWDVYPGSEAATSSVEISENVTTSGKNNARFRWAGTYAGTIVWYPIRVSGMARAEDGQTLFGSMKVRHTDTSFVVDVRPSLVYYDEDFVFISKDVPGAWTTLDATVDVGFHELTVYGFPPANTKWVACLPEVDGTTVPGYNAGISVDDISIRNYSLDPIAYEDPRKQIITVQATRVNEICDPQPASTSLMWGSWGDTLGAADGINPIDGVSGGLLITSVAANDYVTITNAAVGEYSPDKQVMAGLTPGIPYVFSVWVRKIQDVDIRATLYAALGEGIYQADSPSYDEVVATGDPTDDRIFRTDASSRSWVRLQVPFTLGPTGGTPDWPHPIIEVNSVWDGVTSPLPAGDVFEAIAFQVEQGSVATEYFDGSFGADYLWETTADISRSHHYEAYLTGSNRIDDVIAQYIPFGVPFEVQYAQPDTGPRELLDAYGRPLGDTFG